MISMTPGNGTAESKAHTKQKMMTSHSDVMCLLVFMHYLFVRHNVVHLYVAT